MSTTTVFDPMLTEDGQAAAFNASNDGIELQLTHVSFGTGHYDPTGAETELLNEVSGKLTIAGGSRPTLTQIRMTSVWRALTGTYAIGEVGFWSGTTLVFVWSRADGSVIGYKTPGVDFVLFNDLGFTQVPAGSINITIDPDASVALAALAAHEGADNAHPQYVRYDVFPAAQVNLWSKAVTGTANDILITMQDGVHVDAYTDGLMIRFKAAAQSTGAATVNIDGKGVVPIKKGGGDPLEPGDIRAGGIYELVFDTDHFELAGGVGGSGFFKKFQHIATAGQTEFAASYTPGSILVFQNGRELGESAYVATDGLKVTLNTPATLSDDLLVVAFTAFSVADTFSKAELSAKYKLRGVFTSLSDNTLLTAAHEGVIILDATAGDRTLTLPAADAAFGVRDLLIRRLDNTGNRAKVQASGADKIKFHTHLNAAGYGFLYLMGSGDYWHLRSDGVGGWWPIGRHDNNALGRPVFETTTMVSPGGWGVFSGSIFTRADWPWLWDHAQQSGMLTTEAARFGMEGGWTRGDGSTTFRGPDGRAEFLRVLDSSRGIDFSRVAGSWQQATGIANYLAADGSVSMANADPSYIGGPLTVVRYAGGGGSDSFRTVRPRNIAYPGRIKLI